MPRTFNTTAVCVPEIHYMVNIDQRLQEISRLVDGGKYFAINRARQYGKTTTLMALSHYLQKRYHIVSMDFQTFGSADFSTEAIFSSAFAGSFLDSFQIGRPAMTEELHSAIKDITQNIDSPKFTLRPLFQKLAMICAASDKPLVLIIDEVDSAANNQVFLDFLAQLRAQYIRRFQQPAFWSVILAGVYDIRNLKQKLRPEEEHKYNSPWNIAADFNVDMSFSKDDIAGMIQEYENDYQLGMNIDEIAGLLSDYTSGYPFLVSRLCQLMDEDVSIRQVSIPAAANNSQVKSITSEYPCNREQNTENTCVDEYNARKAAWTKTGFLEAVRILLSEKNTLFESLIGKLHAAPRLGTMLKTILFTGKTFSYSADESIIDMAAMFGFIKNLNGIVAISNRIFEIRLYNYYLSEDEIRGTDIGKASLREKNQFIVDGHLNMRRILEKFVVHFTEIYGSRDEKFLEEEGRQYFLLYLKPVINGIGNYYIEARTRDLRRTDIIVDYCGEQYIIEMKIWHGEEYNKRGEQQLLGYLDDYHADRGYLLSFNFNRNKKIGVQDIFIDRKVITEAVV